VFSFAQIANGSFESWTDLVPNSWTTIDDGINITQETNNIHIGISASVEVITKQQDITDIRQTISVIQGHEYTISAWIKHTEGNIKVRLYRDGFSVYSDKDNKSWQQITSTFTANKTDIEIGLRFYDQTGFDGSEIVYIDDFSIIDNSAIAILNWGSDTFIENANNDGSIQNTISVSLSGDTFSTIGKLSLNTDFNTSNIPKGLTVSITTVSATQVSVTLTGYAENHTTANNISNMSVVFKDNVFTNNDASNIINSAQMDLKIKFYDNYSNKLIITEIYYNPPESGSDSLEFIEIYNSDTVGVNLKDYSIKSAIDYTFEDITIESEEYIVVAKDSVAILNTFDVNVCEWSSGGLNNTSEIVELLNPNGKLIDSVKYSNKSPWVDANGTGYSLVLCNYNFDNSLPESWVLSSNYVDTNSNGNKIWASPLSVDTICPFSPKLSWSNTVFNESHTNDGSIEDTIFLLLSNERFSISDTNLIQDIHFTTNNVSDGLDVNVYILNDTVAEITLRGNAFNNNPIDDVFDLTITFLDAIFYRKNASLVDNYFLDSLTINYIDLTSLKENIDKKLFIYPNPATDMLYINGKITDVEIFDIRGNLIMRTVDNTINLSMFERGVYLIKLTSNSIVKVEKAVVK
jgi:hypothetical protein